MSSQNLQNCRVAEFSRYRTKAAIQKLLRAYSLFRNKLIHKFLSRTLHHRFKNISQHEMGLFLSFCLNTGKYWSHKNHSDFLRNISDLLNTPYKRIMYTCLLYFSFLFINTFIGESPFSFCDIFYEYFEINFKNYFVN